MIRTWKSARFLAALTLAGLALMASPARAALIVTVQSATVAAGSTGNTIEVLLTNGGNDAVSIDGFSFGITPDAGVTFNGVSTATSFAPYIFDGASFFGPEIATTLTPNLIASDFHDNPGVGFSLAGGATVSLGLVSFDVASTASGDLALLLNEYPDTSFIFDNVEIQDFGLVAGIITVNAAPPPTNAVPEPSTLTLAALSLVGLAVHRRRAPIAK